MIIKILNNNINSTEVAIIILVIKKILEKRETRYEKKFSNWFLYSRLNKTVNIKYLSSKNIWMKSSFDF